MRNNAPLPNVSGMLVFARVVEEGSFSAAARKLGLSKASVSREISNLEQRLGAQLLRRTTRRMSLTEAGEVFHERCQRVVEAAKDAELSVSELQDTPRGVIRLAAPMSFGHLELAPRLPRFLERHPYIRVDVDATDRIVDLVYERVDLSVRIGRPRQQNYVRRKLCPIRVLICASPEYLERRGIPRTPEDLADHVCLGYTGRTATWRFSTGERIQTTSSLNINNGDALRQAALVGHGIVYLPTFLLAEDIRAGRLIPVLTPHTQHETNLLALYPESRHVSSKVRAMIDWLAEELGPEPAWDEGLPVAGRDPDPAITIAS
jgi:DNA-binding transcriptional LysR family regulator